MEQKNIKKSLSELVNGCAGCDDVMDKNHLLNRILQHKSINLAAAKSEMQEARCIQWTTAKKMMMWFNNWGHDLVELGFATKLNDDGLQQSQRCRRHDAFNGQQQKN